MIKALGKLLAWPLLAPKLFMIPICSRCWFVITSYSIHYTKLYDNRQPHPRAAQLPAGRAALEELENLLTLMLGNPRAVITDEISDQPMVAFSTDFDGAPLKAGIADSVADQVGEDLRQQRGGDGDGREA